MVLLLATTAAMLSERLDSRVPAVLAAGLYALTIVVGVRISRRRARVHWQTDRAVAELLKSLAWQYMVHGGSFHSRVPHPDAVFATQLDTQLRELRRVGWADERNGDPVGGAAQITSVMRAVRAKPFEVRRDIYLRDRIMEQHAWYRRRASQAHRASMHWSAVTVTLTSFALAAAVLRAMGLIGGWDVTGLLSTAAAAGVAWQEVKRHRPLTYAHSLIEQELETLRIAMGTTVTEDRWADAVGEAERIVSPQHSDWLGRFGN